MNRVRAILWSMLGAAARFVPKRPRMTVLLYHSISDTDRFSVDPASFETQMRELKARYEIVPLARAFAHAAGQRVERDSVALTFDDGYADFARFAVPVLRMLDMPATVFVIGGVADRTELGNELPLLSDADRGAIADPRIEIGSHGHTHRKLKKLSVDELRSELIESRKAIEEQFGKPVRYLAYPKGSFNRTVQEATREAGYAGAVSIIARGVRNGDDPYALPRVQIDAWTTSVIFRAKLTRAADWYYALWRVIS